MHRALLALVILAATLAGCGVASDEDQLVDTHWRLAAFTEVTPAFQGVVPAEEQANYTIDFLAERRVRGQGRLQPGRRRLHRPALEPDDHPRSDHDGVLRRGVVRRAVRPHAQPRCHVRDPARPADDHAQGRREPDVHRLPEPSASASAEAAASGDAATATPEATEKPTDKPTEKPTAKPTEKPTARARPRPSPPPSPTASPTATPSAAPSASPGRTPPPASQGLLGYSWQLASISEKNPAFQGEIPADQRSKYTLELAQDGTFSALADCNTVTGTYTTADASAASGNLTITPGAGSAKACPDGSFGDLYTYGLGNVTSYAIAGGKLTLTLLDDGQLAFE